MNSDTKRYVEAKHRHAGRLAVVTVRCEGCHARRDITQPVTDIPRCGRCSSRMFPVVGRLITVPSAHELGRRGRSISRREAE